MEVLVRGRRERRYLTGKYQARQLRLAYETNQSYPYDEQRHLQRPIALKKRFLDILCDNYTRLDSWGRYDIGLDDIYNRPEVMGRLKRHSFDMCSIKRCPGCCNPRRRWACSTEKDKITLAERKALLHLKEEIEIYKGERNEKNEKIERFTAR